MGEASKIIHVCTDRIHPMDARRVNAARSGASADDAFRTRMAVLTGKKWDNGRTLKVGFIDGLAEVQQRVITFAKQWEQFANLTLDFTPLPAGTTPDIRISFAQEGSWSYLGTDALGIRDDLCTMNFGWLTPEVSDREYERVVVHEFGHALGAIHEHQSPGATIPWDKDAVYKYYGGPPNNWSKEEVDVNLFELYDKTITQFSQFDPNSIMLYAIPNDLTVGDWEVGWNTTMSDTDKAFIASLYPKKPDEGPEIPHIDIDGKPVAAAIGKPAEEDEFLFDVTDSGTYTVETTGNTDVVMALFGPDTREKRIGVDDDSGRGLNARLRIDLDAGEYHVVVRHYSKRGKGAYKVKVTSS
jgi:hypothetical protein